MVFDGFVNLRIISNPADENMRRLPWDIVADRNPLAKLVSSVPPHRTRSMIFGSDEYRSAYQF